MLSEENSTKNDSQVTRSAMQTSIPSCPRDVFMRQLDFVLSHWTESIPKAWLQNMSQSWSRQDGPLWKHTALWPMAPGCCSLDSVIVMAYFTLATFPALLWHVSRGRMLGCVLNCSLHSQRQTGQPKDTNKDRRSRQHGDPPPPPPHTHTHNARWLLTFLLQLACSLKGILHLILHSTVHNYFLSIIRSVNGTKIANCI